MQTIAFGEILWDVFSDREFLGGAPLNFSAALQRLGNSVSLISGVGQDDRGARALGRMNTLGLSPEFVKVVSGRKTGTAVITTDAAGNASYVIPRNAAFDDLALEPSPITRLRALHAEWIYFGTLAQTNGINEALVTRLLHELPQLKRFYDLNLRTEHWNLPLLERLSQLATVLKLNEEEAELLFGLTCGPRPYSLGAFCEYWSSTYQLETICITRGSSGCAVFSQGTLKVFDGFKIKVVDTVGAGDAFAAAFLHASNAGWAVSRQAAFANAAGALVASRAGAIPDWSSEECLALMETQSSTSRS